MTLTHFIVYSLAIWRIASLLVRESGPFNMFKNFREWAGIMHDDGGFPMIIPDNFTAQVLSCVWCSSLWVGFFFTVFILLAPVPALYTATIFAFSTMAILIDNHVGKK